MIWKAIFFILLIMPTTTVTASTFFEIKPELDPNRPASKNERLIFARALYEKFETIYKAIPNLSPSQEKWLESETSADDPSRVMRAYQSDEAYLKNTKQMLKSLLDTLVFISQNEEGDRRHEILSWLVVADRMMYFALSSHITEVVNRRLAFFSSDERFGDDSCMIITFDAIGHSIQNSIIAPYIAEILPE